MTHPAGHIDRQLSKRTLVLATLGALILAVFVLFAAVIPAEFGKDPSGLGKLTGLGRLWGPKQIEVDANAGEISRTHDYASGYRSDVVEIHLEGAFNNDFKTRELEYKVHMNKDAVVLYEWEVIGARNPDDLYYDFHGHTLTEAGTEMTVANYKKDFTDHMNGSLMAPFDGIHGWFFRNGGIDPITVRIRMTGYYDLIPPGQEGNLSNITPVESTPPEGA